MKNIDEIWKKILAQTIAQILISAIDKVWVEKFEDQKDYWNNRKEIIDQIVGERIERGEEID